MPLMDLLYQENDICAKNVNKTDEREALREIDSLVS
jgi:hypothetical protein